MIAAGTKARMLVMHVKLSAVCASPAVEAYCIQISHPLPADLVREYQRARDCSEAMLPTALCTHGQIAHDLEIDRTTYPDALR